MSEDPDGVVGYFLALGLLLMVGALLAVIVI
jgi:hypothetical protein